MTRFIAYAPTFLFFYPLCIEIVALNIQILSMSLFQAPDALDQLSVEATTVLVKHKVPYYELKVPQQYRLDSYGKHNVHESSRGYVAPRLARELRTGAEVSTRRNNNN